MAAKKLVMLDEDGQEITQEADILDLTDLKQAAYPSEKKGFIRVDINNVSIELKKADALLLISQITAALLGAGV